MKRSWEPKSYPIRDPRTTTQQQGRIVNPPRNLKLGGKGEARMLDITKGANGPRAVGPVSDRGRGGR